MLLNFVCLLPELKFCGVDFLENVRFAASFTCFLYIKVELQIERSDSEPASKVVIYTLAAATYALYASIPFMKARLCAPQLSLAAVMGASFWAAYI